MRGAWHLRLGLERVLVQQPAILIPRWRRPAASIDNLTLDVSVFLVVPGRPRRRRRFNRKPPWRLVDHWDRGQDPVLPLQLLDPLQSGLFDVIGKPDKSRYIFLCKN